MPVTDWPRGGKVIQDPPALDPQDLLRLRRIDQPNSLLAHSLIADRELPVLAVSLLGDSVRRRGIPGPGTDGSPYCPDPAGWITWLRSLQ